jgi:hypothetical protein
MMTMTKLLFVAVAAGIVSTSARGELVKSPAPSPYSEVKQTVGVTDFTIKYSRPGVKDREIFGGLVPFGEVWRTGANATTKIAFDSEIEFGGKKIPAGEYVLFTIPGKDEWTVILYGDLDVAGAGAYDASKDALRVAVKPTALPAPVETFTIGFDHLRDDSALLCLDWATTRVAVPVKIDTVALTQASIEKAKENMDAWTARDYANAAEFTLKQQNDLKQATEWMGKAASMNDKAFWWQHRYAKLLAEQGNKEAALEAAQKSLATAKAAEGGDNGYIKMNEDFIATLQ